MRYFGNEYPNHRLISALLDKIFCLLYVAVKKNDTSFFKFQPLI